MTSADRHKVLQIATGAAARSVLDTASWQSMAVTGFGDVCELLDEMKITRVHMLGYSMRGAITQEFVRKFLNRVKSLEQ